MNPNMADTADERAKLSQPAGQPSYPPPEYSHIDTAEDGDDFNYGYNFEFTEKSIRLGFIRKVYGILLCQLTVTMIFITVFLYVEPLRVWNNENPWMWILAFIATLVCIIVLACCPDVRRSSPANLIFLAIFTICESWLLGSVASCYESMEVLLAVGITAGVALALTIFAFQTKWDFTMFSGALLVFLVVLMFFGIFAIIFHNKVLSILYACLGALLFSMYLVFDTQMMLGGKHKYSLSPEEYIFAALNLYLDIVNLFLFILSIIGQARN